MVDRLFSSWAEFCAFAFVFVGIFIAFLSPSAFISYVIIFLAGMIAGRILWERRRNTKTAYVMITLGFIFGFSVGALRYYGNPFVVVVLFAVGVIVMHKLSERGFIPETWF
jgi:CHASE2 domain-containing sensor protein